jgi:arabinan endo-1,5-alpha-L-arabinosidase
MGAGGHFYAYTTQSTYKHLIHMPILVSDDAIEWRFIGDALPDLPPWADTSDPDTWGPDIIRIGDSYHIYFAERMNATGVMGIALATSESPEGPFHVRGEPLLDAPGFVHPFVFREPNGRLLMYTSSSRGPIQVQQLSKDGMTLFGAAQPVLTPSDVTTYESRIEGPAVVRHRGYYFLFYSGNRCCGRKAHYAVLVARSRSPFGPFERAPTNPILAGNEYFDAPGDGSVLRDASSAYFLLYHAMEQSNPLNSRSLMLDRIRWKDGWPIVNGGSGPSRGPQTRPKVEN